MSALRTAPPRRLGFYLALTLLTLPTAALAQPATSVLALLLTDAPLAPTGLTGECVEGKRVLLTWTDNATTEDTYQIWRRPVGGTWKSWYIPANSATYTDDDDLLLQGTSYEYRVRCLLGGVGSNYTSTVTVQVNSSGGVGVPSYGVFRGGDSVALVDPGAHPTWSMMEYRNVQSWRNAGTLGNTNLIAAYRHVLRTALDPHWVRRPVYFNQDGAEAHPLTSPPTSLYFSPPWNLSGITPTNLGGQVFPGNYEVTAFAFPTMQMGQVSGGAVPQACDGPSTATTVAPAVSVVLQPSQLAAVQHAGSTTAEIGNTSPKVTLMVVRKWWVCTSAILHSSPSSDDDGDGVYDSVHPFFSYYWAEHKQVFYRSFSLALVKVEADDASVDTRRSFGQPNLEGALPGDPNTGLNYVQFGAWNYKGGLFLGNMPYRSTHDQSGAARVQLYFAPSTSTTQYLGSLLSFLPTEVVDRTGYQKSFSVGVYEPADYGAKATTEGTVRWDTHWDVDILHPFSTVSPIDFQTRAPDEYAFAQAPLTTADNPGLVLALTNEPWDPATGLTSPDTNGAPTGWFYIAGKEWELQHQTPPDGYTGFYAPMDSRPRIWRLWLNERGDWHGEDVLTGTVLG